jgi:hypothetical protein
MSDAIIFAIGGVVFIAATWTTIAFLLTRVMALEEQTEREGETG